MANDRLSQIEARFEAKSEARDAQLGELTQTLATVAESVRQAADRDGAIEVRITALENNRPGLASLWGPAGLVGSLLAFILYQAIDPVRQDITTLKVDDHRGAEVQARNTQHIQDIDQRLDVHREQLDDVSKDSIHSAEARGQIQGKVEALQSQLNAVDNIGSRRANSKP